MSERQPKRIIPTQRAIDLLDKVTSTHGPVLLLQGSRRDAEAGPICQSQESDSVVEGDVYLGDVVADLRTPFYIDQTAFGTWWDQQIELDVDESPSAEYPGESPEAARFVVRPRAFDEAEMLLFVAEGPPLRGRHH